MSVDDRIAVVLARRRTRMPTSGAGRERAETRTRVLEELPRMTARLSAAVAELNDRLGDEHVWIRLDAGERSPAAEATFDLGVEGDPTEGARLGISVDFAGRLTCVVRQAQAPVVVRTSTIFTMQTHDFVELLVAWFELRYA